MQQQVRAPQALTRSVPTSRTTGRLPLQPRGRALITQVAYIRTETSTSVQTEKPQSPTTNQHSAVPHSGHLAEVYQQGYEAGLKAAQADAQEKGLIAPDSVGRTALKSLTWRILSTGTTIGLALFMFKDSIAADAALELGVVEFLSKYGLYFAHERLWAVLTFLL